MDIIYRGHALMLSAEDRPQHCDSSEALENCLTEKYNVYGLTDDPHDCQKECKRTAGCKWFNWDKLNRRCYLKTDKGTKGETPGATGPVSCPITSGKQVFSRPRADWPGQDCNRQFCWSVCCLCLLQCSSQTRWAP